ncbi:hydroxycarboxylic acid receptor 2 [Dicentrarchus labrax]|uniref:G-protein coupled receptors family 1 profile domain-containing protein n=1 Tax=Dicentrarchus labrax TaxID=13489 RepID=A0A8P4K2S1_DICLA|nr:hydroxycarboxylic acid receptor 2 [Dicentrarchus labrax]
MNSTGATEMMNKTLMHCSMLPTQDLGTLFQRILMILEIVVGLPANIVALCIFCFHMKYWKPHTLFLFNLVLADFLLLMSVPFRIDANLRGENWVFGPTWCRINLFMLSVNRSASIAFMTAVAVDRYFKVVHPLHCVSRITLTQSALLSGLMWMAVIALRTPLLTINLLRQHGNISLCRSFSSYTVVPLVIKLHYVAFTVEFLLPWFLLLFCSARITCFLLKRQVGGQKKVRRAILAVGVITLVFTFCFMPSVLTGLGGVYIKYFHPKDCMSYNQITRVFVLCIGFTYFNSALDPIVYAFCSSMFRDAFKSFFSHLGYVKNNARADNTVTAEQHKLSDY